VNDFIEYTTEVLNLHENQLLNMKFEIKKKIQQFHVQKFLKNLNKIISNFYFKNEFNLSTTKITKNNS
jgi:inorganic pyrophosphatase